jgi:hypothetical protein
MKRETLYVTVANGTKVPFEEFERWSQHKQSMYTDHPIRKINWGLTHSEKMSSIVRAQYQAGTRCDNWNYGKRNGQSMAVMTPAGEFETLKGATTFYKIDLATLKEWIESKPNEFYYMNPLSAEQIRKLRPGKRAVITPAGKFETINSAARHYGVSPRTIKTWIRSMRKTEFKYIQLMNENDYENAD